MFFEFGSRHRFQGSREHPSVGSEVPNRRIDRILSMPSASINTNCLTRVPKRALLSLSKGRRGHHLPATVSRRGPRPIGSSGGTTPGAVSPGGRTAGGRCAGHPGLHGLPRVPLAEAVVQQPAGTAEPGDPSPQSLPPKGDVVGIFPNRLSARRLVGAVLAEQHDEWAEARRYLTIPNAVGNEALPEPNMLDAAT